MFNKIMFIILLVLIFAVNLIVGYFVGYKYGFHEANEEYKRREALNNEYGHIGSYNNLSKPPTIPPVNKEGELTMSDTVKLIIEIPKNKYKWIREHQGVTDFQTTENLYDSIYNATPLEDIEKQIAEKSFTGNDGLDYVEMLVVCKTLEGE